MSYASITQTGKDEGHPVIAALLAIKHTFSGAIDHALPSPESALLSGLLLGGKQSLGAEWIERFQTAGIIHIVVLSGYNMSIVAEWLVVAFRFLGFFGSLSVGALGIVLFALMTGAGATVVRAAILALLVLLAKATGKTSEMGRALLFAGATMVAVNPSLLSFDPSFQLSFLASLGLVFVAPILDTRIGLWKGSRLWREVLISTLATQLTVLPLLLFQTGMLSLVALPANLLVLPLIPLSMLLGFLAGVGALFFPFLATLFGAPVFLPLAFIFVVAEYAAQIPYAAVPFSLSAFWTFLCYGVLLWWVIRARSRMTSAVPQTVPSLALPPLGSPEPGACDKKETQ
jgi:competence protein ComEC